MSTFRPIWIAALYGFVLLACSISHAKAARRVALVVGNSHYSNASLFLANPKNDAEDVAAALRAVGFEVLQAIDANKRDLDLNMAKFARLATDADAALFYYAGHAVQYQGRNYLMPVDSEVEDDISLRYQMVLLDDVLAAAERATGVKIVILDACRNNPIADNINRKLAGLSRGAPTTRGLARIDKALGMVVAYSTAADDVAADGSGRNSPFTSALLRRLREPGLEIGAMFRRIAADVNEKTQGRQRPETYVSLIGEYYLNQTDRPVWDQIKDTADASAFRSFIQRFPSSPRASDAQYRLTMLERAEAARIAEQSKVEQARAEELRLREEARIKEAAAKHNNAIYFNEMALSVIASSARPPQCKPVPKRPARPRRSASGLPPPNKRKPPSRLDLPNRRGWRNKPASRPHRSKKPASRKRSRNLPPPNANAPRQRQPWRGRVRPRKTARN